MEKERYKRLLIRRVWDLRKELKFADPYTMGWNDAIEEVDKVIKLSNLIDTELSQVNKEAV